MRHCVISLYTSVWFVHSSVVGFAVLQVCCFLRPFTTLSCGLVSVLFTPPLWTRLTATSAQPFLWTTACGANPGLNTGEHTKDERPFQYSFKLYIHKTRENDSQQSDSTLTLTCITCPHKGWEAAVLVVACGLNRPEWRHTLTQLSSMSANVKNHAHTHKHTHTQTTPGQCDGELVWWYRCTLLHRSLLKW